VESPIEFVTQLARLDYCPLSLSLSTTTVLRTTACSAPRLAGPPGWPPVSPHVVDAAGSARSDNVHSEKCNISFSLPVSGVSGNVAFGNDVMRRILR